MVELEHTKKSEKVYEMRGVPIHAYLAENGEFKWIPTVQACGDDESVREILEVLRKMPEERRAVWASRLDVEQAKITCPIIKEKPELCREFDEFCAVYNKQDGDNKKKGGDTRNE